MGRGKQSKPGDERVAPNGYHYVKRKKGWVLKHHVIAEKKLGRPVRKNERVYFKDGDRNNFDEDNIEVRRVRTKEDRIKELDQRIDELKAERNALVKELKR